MHSDSVGRAVQIGSFVGTPYVLSLSVVSANVQLQPCKRYRLWASANCFFQFGTSNAVTATSNSHPLWGGLDALHATDDANVWIAAIVPTATGVLYISEIDTDTA